MLDQDSLPHNTEVKMSSCEHVHPYLSELEVGRDLDPCVSCGIQVRINSRVNVEARPCDARSRRPLDRMADLSQIDPRQRVLALLEDTSCHVQTALDRILMDPCGRRSTLSRLSFAGRTRQLLFQALAQLRQLLIQRRRRRINSDGSPSYRQQSIVDDQDAMAFSQTEGRDTEERNTFADDAIMGNADHADAIMEEAGADIEGNLTSRFQRS